jgi:hypothetical protein
MQSVRIVVTGTALAAFGMLCLSHGVATAQFVEYTDRASFDAAAGGGLATANFDSVSGGEFQTLSNSDAASIAPGVTFSSSGGGPDDLFVAPPDFGGTTAIGTTSVFGDFFGTPLISTFSPNVTAVGTDLSPFDGSGDTAVIDISVAGSVGPPTDYSITPAVGSSGFFGVIASGGTTIGSITFQAPSNFTIGAGDDFEFTGAAASTPEPGSIALLISSGAIGGVILRRRRLK